MSPIKQYVLSIIIASVVIAVIEHLSPKKKLIRFITGVFLSISLLAPLAGVRLLDYTEYILDIDADAKEAVGIGETYMEEQLRKIIKEKIEAYILEKALQLDAQVQVNVTCSSINNFAPECIEITGNISPYARKRLQDILKNDFCIPEEKQIWT